jgi:hypothetical protein
MTVPYTFGTESSPIPLSQLDANFAAPVAYANIAGNVTNATQANITAVGVLTSLSVSGNVTAANLRTTGSTSTTGNVIAGNILTLGVISAYGGITSAGNISTVGVITANGSITTQASILAQGAVSATGSILTASTVSATGNIVTQNSVLAQGIVSATGNVVTASYFIGNFRGNVTGNVSVAGSNTQVLFNQNGNIGASAGFTYTTSPNALGILGTISAQGNITTGSNLTVSGNLVVSGATQLVGLVTAPTASVGTANNQVATTAFVNNFAGNLGTMSQQNANSVNITGGNIVASNISTGTFSFIESGGKLLIRYGGTTILSIDSGGNITTIQNVTGYGTP